MLSLEELNLIKGCFLFRKSKEDELQSFLESEDCLVCSFSKEKTFYSAVRKISG